MLGRVPPMPGAAGVVCSDVGVTGTTRAPDVPAQVRGRIARHRGRHRWRSLIFVASGDGSVRRRASDVVRLALAVVSFILVAAAIRVGVSLDRHLVDALVPPPEGLQWLISALWFMGSLGVTVVLVGLALLSRRSRVLVETAAAGLASWALCGVLGATIGTTAGRPADAHLSGVSTAFPLARLAAAMAIAAVVLPYLSRAVHRVIWALLVAGAMAGVLHGAGLPLDVVASLLVGWGVAAVVHLALGTPAGLPTPDDVVQAVGDLGTDLAQVTLAPDQEWGVARYVGADGAGRPVEVALYGRDATDAQALGRAWRFAWYRDAGPRLAVNRLQQVEHEAYLTLLAAGTGTSTSEVVVAGESPETGDAVLVTHPPPGRPMGDLGPDDVPTATLDDLFAAVDRLGLARIAHGSVNPANVVVIGPGSDAPPDGVGSDAARPARVGLKDLRRGASGAPDEWLERDLADALVTAAVAGGIDPAVAAARRAIGPERLARVLAHLQPAALDPHTRDAAHRHKGLLAELRRRGAAAAGVEEPALAEVHRVSWASVGMGVGALVGVVLIVQQFSGVDDLWSTLAHAQWSWVLVAFVLAQLTNAAQAVSVQGSVSAALPFGPTLGLELANAFTGLVAGTVGTTATIIRYFQRRGLAVSVAVSSGVLVTVANMVTQAVLFVTAFLLTRSSFSFDVTQPSGSGSTTAGGSDAWILVLIVVALAAAGTVTAIPRFRRQAVAKLKPQLDAARTNLHDLSGEPAKLIRLFGGAVAAQVLFALVLGASLHAYGASASLGELLVINTIASLLGGIAPVPGGMGVIEAGLIAGFTALGIPNTIAVAATLTARLMTCYLPPIWGYPTLVWMRRRQYL